MSTYIIFTMGEPKYKVEADFYDVTRGFMSFYGENNELIASFNADEIDFVVDKDYQDNVKFLEKDEDCEENQNDCSDCDDIECENNPLYVSPKKDVNPPKKSGVQQNKSNDNFDELFRRVLGLYGKK